MRSAFRTLAFTFSLVASGGAAAADVISDWNGKAVAAGYATRTGNSLHSRNMAIVNIAMFEALNSIEPRYAPYRARLDVEPDASREAAAAAAAHAALVKLHPDQEKEFDKALQASLAALPDGAAKTNGRRVGERAAALILAERANDASTATVPYRPHTTAGKWVPTTAPLSSNWMAVRPFAMKSGDQFRPPAPYALTSAQWAKDYNEIKTLGAKTGSARSAEQTDIARFWELSGPATYNPVAHQIVSAKGLDLLDNARVCTLLAIATADAAIAIFDAKYAYGFWRPVTAIRNGDIDGNDQTDADPAWEPLIATPMHPEYPCAHCTFQGSAAGVLRSMFGDAVPRFTLTSTTAQGVTRSFDRLSDYVNDVVNARIYEGVHYRRSGEVGAAMGARIGEYTVQNLFKPLH